MNAKSDIELKLELHNFLNRNKYKIIIIILCIVSILWLFALKEIIS